MPADIMTIETTNPDAGGEPAATDATLDTQGGDSSPHSGHEPEASQPEGEAGKAGNTDDGEEGRKDVKPTPEGLRKRFAELTGQRKEAMAQADGLRTEVEQLRSRLAELESAGGKPAQQQPNLEDGIGNPPKWEDYQSQEEFDAAQQEWTRKAVAAEVDRRLADSNRQGEEQRAAAEAAREFEEWSYGVFEKGSEKYGQEFEKVFLQPEQGGPSISRPMLDAVTGDESAPDVLMYLLKKPEESKRILSLPPLLQFKETVLLKAKLEFAAQKPQITNAPTPPTPISGRSSGSKDPSTMSMKEYAEYRDSKERRARK